MTACWRQGPCGPWTPGPGGDEQNKRGQNKLTRLQHIRRNSNSNIIVNDISRRCGGYCCSWQEPLAPGCTMHGQFCFVRKQPAPAPATAATPATSNSSNAATSNSSNAATAAQHFWLDAWRRCQPPAGEEAWNFLARRTCLAACAMSSTVDFAVQLSQLEIIALAHNELARLRPLLLPHQEGDYYDRL